MATSTLSAQVVDLVGTFSDEDALDDWMTAGAKEISNMFPPPLLHAMAAQNTLNASTTTYDMDSGGKVLSVVRNNGTRNFPCREIPATFSGHKDDSSSLMYYGTATDPVYYIDNGVLNIYPAPTGSGGSGTALVTAINYPTITAAGAATIANFPNEAEYLVVIYASLRALQQKMNDKSSSLPSDLVSPVLDTVSTSLPSFTAPSDFVQPVPPIAPDAPSFTYTDASVTDIVQPILSISDKSALTTSVPTYTKPVFNAPSLTSIGSMTLPSVPVASSTSAQTLTINGTAPTYTGPVVAPDFAQVDTYVDTDEDVELAGAKIQEINTQLQEFSSKIQDSIQVFNKENVEFQAKLNKDVQDVTMSDREEARKLQKYQQDVAKYSAEVNKEVQRFVNEDFNVKLQEWQIEYRQRVASYQVDIQNEVNKYNKENMIYQEDIGRKTENFNKDIQQVVQNAQNEITVKSANLTTGVQIALQNAVQDFQQDVQEYQAKLSKYQSEVNVYTQDIQSNGEKFKNELAKNTASFQSDINKYQAETAKVSAENQGEVAKFTAQVQDFGARLQKIQADYQWLQGQYQQLSGEYQRGVTMLRGHFQQPQQEERRR